MRASASGLWLAIGVVVLGGCTCGTNNQCTDLVINFDSPTDGATVPATTDVSISVVDTAGAAVDFDKATVCTRLAPQRSSPCASPGTTTQCSTSGTVSK